MTTITYQIETEVEFNRIAPVLDELEIPYTFRLNTDTSFPVLGQNLPYGYFDVPEQFENICKSVFNNQNQNKTKHNLENKNNQKRSLDFKHYLLIFYSLIVTFLFIKYWHIDRNNNNDKNFIYEWNFGNTILSAKDKNTGVTTSMSIDDNYNFNFERLQLYSKDGTLISVSYDRNEDGYYEEILFFNNKKEITGVSYDSNNDGVIERMELVLDNRDTLKLSDVDQDGYFKIEK